jgi:transposase
MRQMRAHGFTVRELSWAFSCSVATVHRHCSDIKPPRRPHPRRRVDPAEAKALKAEGWSYRQIARRQGVSHNRVFVALNPGSKPVSKPNPADAHIDLILECFAEGFTLDQTASRLEWEKVKATPEDVAATLRKFRDNLAAQTETRLAAGF